MFTDSKTIIAGNFIEIFKYEKKVWCGTLPESRSSGGGQKKKDGQRSATSLQRSKGTLKRLINANACNWFDKNGKAYIPIFFTLTFAENLTDIKKANYEFSKFIQRFNYEMKYKQSYLKYAVVIEFQERGAVHYHAVFFNLPYVKDLKNKLLKLWGNGFTNYRKIKDVKNVGAYMSKYMSKNANDSRLYGQKSYFTSQGLHKPKIKNDENVANFLLSFLLDKIEPYEKIYESNHCVNVTYRYFDLTDEQELKKSLLAFIK